MAPHANTSEVRTVDPRFFIPNYFQGHSKISLIIKATEASLDDHYQHILVILVLYYRLANMWAYV